MSQLDRRKFIRQASAYVFSIWAVGLVSCVGNPVSKKDEDQESDQLSSSFNGSSSSKEILSFEDGYNSSPASSSDPIQNVCSTTTEDILGPYFREGAPERSLMRSHEASEYHIDLKGKILASDCSTPIKGAVIDLWHADLNGAYDNDSADFKYRAKLQVDESGEYLFQTILPGRYLNGSQYRPSHLHIKVSAKGYHDLVSQIYFKDDPYNEVDRWASDPDAKSRTLTYQENSKGVRVFEFDIHMGAI